jgi:multidrug resistance efflux pump
MNCPRWIPAAFLASSIACGADDLPKRAPGETLDVQPKLMLNDLPDVPLPSPTAPTASTGEAMAVGVASEADVRRLEDRVEQAKKTAVSRERLFRAGVFSKVQVEQSELSVARLTKDLENARLDVAQEFARDQSKRLAAGEIAREEAEKAVAALAAAEATAKDASQRWDKAQFDAAQANLQRQRQLYAVGATTKNQLRRAEERVAAMKAGTAP